MEKTVYEGKFVKVTEEEINGKLYERAYIINAVFIIPFTAEGKILVIKEKRPHETPKVRWKIISGVYEPEYSFKENVNRELQEEIGKKALKVKHYVTIKQTGTVNDIKKYAIATRLINSKVPNPDGEDSILDVKAVSLEEILDRTLKGKLSKGTTAYVLLRLYHDIKDGKISINY